jgi:hypothetical protein
MSILLKKVTSTVSVVAIIASAMSASLVASAASSFTPYADALATAGIIGKQSTEAGYNLGNNVTRAEMAKVAVNIKGAKVAECTGKVFSDVTSKLGDLCGYVEAAATAGLVNSTAAKFRPMDLVTRAEALKMLLSAKGIAPSTTDAGFKDLGTDASLNGYINAAAAAGIINKGTSFNPNNTATRGEAFKIAANSAGLTTSATVDATGDLNLGDLFGDLGTSTGTTSTTTGTVSTGTTAPTTTVAAGDLSVALNPATPVAGTQIPSNGIVRFAVVDLAAGGSDISVNTLELQKAGLATIPSGTKVWFEKAGTRVSGKASFTSENNAVISFAPAFVVKAGTTESLDMYVELASSAGNDFAFASAAITSSAANVKGSFVTPTLRTASYNVATATIVGGASGQTYNASADSVEFAKFTVANTDGNADTRDIKVQSLTIYQNGSASLTNLSNIVLERNGVVVSSAAVVSGKTLTLTVNDTIKDGATAIYYVKAVVNTVELTSDTYQLYIKNTSDVNMVETASAFRATISSVAPINAATYTVNGGDVRFVRDTASTLSETVAPGTSDVTLMAGTITAKAAVTLEDINLGYTTTVANASVSMNTVYLQIGAATFTATPGATLTGTLNFLGTATVNGTVPVRAYVKLRDTAAGTVKLGTLDINSVVTRKEYVANQNAVTSAIGSIEGRTITIGASTLNVTRTDGLGTTPLAAGAKGVTVYAARFSSTQGNPIALSNLSATTAGNALSYTGGNTSLTLYVDGVAVSTKSLTTATVNFAGFNSTVSTTKAVDIMIKADFSDVTTTGSFNVASIAYSAVDNLTSVTVASTSVAGATFNIASAVGALAATTGDTLVNKSLFTAGAKDQKIASFKVTASNDVIKLKDIVLTGSNLSALSNIRLVDSAMTVLGTASSLTDTGATFANLNTGNGTMVAMDKSVIFYVLADVNATTNVNGVVANVVVAGSDITGSNGAVVVMTGTDVAGASHDVSENTFKVAQTTPVSKALATNAMEFTVNAFGKNQVTLTGASIKTVLGAYTTAGFTGATISIYTKSTNQLVGSATGVTNGGTIVVPLNTYGIVSAGSSTTYVVKVEGLTLNASTNEAWTVSLTSLVAGGLDAATYPLNTETFPLNSVK